MTNVRLPGLITRDHSIEAPLDPSRAGGPTIEVFAREVVAPGRDPETLPWLLFLQGGPGYSSPRPVRADGWLGYAAQRYRVLLLDQRGTGRSSAVSPQTVRGRSAADIAEQLSHYRADAIVADAELFRQRLAGGRPWYTLGQSYGGFATLTYLSRAPHGLAGCYVTGGLAGLTATADEVYNRMYPRVRDRVAGFYQRYPQDAPLVRRVVDRLAEQDVRLPDGDRLTVERFQTLGHAFGMSDGWERLHWLLETAWSGDELSDSFRYDVMNQTGYPGAPLYAAIHEAGCYAQGTATRWAAHRLLPADFATSTDPVPFTGEMIYPWMFREMASLRPFAEAAEILADKADWPALYDPDVLARNEVPVAAAVYHDDMYVDSGLSLQTARAVRNTKVWLTNEWQHDGLRVSGSTVFAHILTLHDLT